MNSSHDFIGAHHALSEVAQIGEFENWLEQNQTGSPDKYFKGYRLLVRSTYQIFQDYLHENRRTLDIESNREYERAYVQIADIDSLRADCEASSLIKNLEKIDGDIYTTHNFETLSEAISTLGKKVIEPFDSLLSRVSTTSSVLSDEEIFRYLSLFSLITFCNDTTRGYPEAFQLGWIENRFSSGELEDLFEGYKTALYWVYTKLSSPEADERVLKDSVLGAEDWTELNSSFKPLRDELLKPFETKFESSRSSVHNIKDVKSHDEISHLLSEAPDAAVGIQKCLNRLFLWDSANKASDVLFGSGSAGFITILLGVKSVRQRLDTDEPIQVRRLRHPDGPGNNFSYAVGLSGWTLNGTGSLHGWAVFIRIATDYSGFGGRQHEIIEEYLDQLSSDSLIEIKEIDVEEEVLEDYLSNQGTRTDHQRSQGSEPEYDSRRLTDILRGGEDTRTEFKREISSSDKITTEIAALANHEGGILVIGVTDEGEIVGIDNIDKADNTVSSLISDKLTPPLSADIRRETIRGKDIIIIEIPDADRPVAFDYVYYGRKGSNKRRLTYSELKERYG